MNKLLAHAQLALVTMSLLYIGLAGLLTVPYIQRHALYLHALRWPLFADFSNTVKYGLPAHRSLNIQLESRDHVRLGAWLILPPDPASTPFSGAPSDADVAASLSSKPTILLFHGNAASRAVSFRVQHASTYATTFHANVLALDYRGYGDSEGTPSEEGLIADARAAWDWVIERGAKAEDVLIVGMSLGTGVSSGLGAQLAREAIRPRGVVLLAPFSSIGTLLKNYHLFGFIPILQPLQGLPALQNFLTRRLRSQFDTASVLNEIKSPIFLAHAKDDHEIPHSHSQSLFDTLLGPLLPTVPALPTAPSEVKSFDYVSYRTAAEERRLRREELVRTLEIPGFGTVRRFARTPALGADGVADAVGDVVHVESLWGGHDRIGLQDTLIDVLGNVFFSTSAA